MAKTAQIISTVVDVAEISRAFDLFAIATRKPPFFVLVFRLHRLTFGGFQGSPQLFLLPRVRNHV